MEIRMHMVMRPTETVHKYVWARGTVFNPNQPMHKMQINKKFKGGEKIGKQRNYRTKRKRS